MLTPDFWRMVRENGGQGALDVLPAQCAYAITTGDAATQETVGTVTTNQVTVWLNGAPQDADNKAAVVLPYGALAPGAGELWLVLWTAWPRQENGVLLLRLSQ
jgi:hypothetical protein